MVHDKLRVVVTSCLTLAEELGGKKKKRKEKPDNQPVVTEVWL